MKKNVLALSITAALIGLTGGAHAMTSLGGATGDATTKLTVNTDGVGQMLIVPYFSAQGDNATLINIVNTDTVGKAVKVRFRGAVNSDDIFDFQVFLSPKDVYAFQVAKDGSANNLARLTTSDNTCTKPAKGTTLGLINGTSFVTARLDQTMTAAGLANGTREGYVEIFNMANIIVGSALEKAILHSQTTGVPTCSGAAWDALNDPNFSFAEAAGKGLAAPTTGLLANWTVVDVKNAATWSGEATAIQAASFAAGGVATPQAGNIVYWPQTAVGLTAAETVAYTADPVLRQIAAVKAAYYDLPDMSTPYTVATTDPLVQANALTASIAATAVSNEFWTETAFGASNDWTFSMPTRRYTVAYDYVGGAVITNAGGSTAYFAVGNNLAVKTNAETFGNGRQICVKKADLVVSPLDREEKVPPAGSVGVVVSPSVPGEVKVLSFCGEAAVLSVNNGAPATGTSSGALKASVALNDVDTSSIGQKYGWLTIATPGATGAGLPMLGSSYVRAAFGANGFGATYKHRLSRPAGYSAN